MDIKFNCKPQLFLKSGEVEQRLENEAVLYNPTPYTSMPTIRFSFQNSWDGGSITINGRTISSSNPGITGDFIIDCERQDIYRQSNRENKNNVFTLSDGEFFELYPGRNTIYFTGISGTVKVAPNWWTV